MDKQKRIALITGASHGIGAGVAQYLSEHGYFVYATYYKDKEPAEKQFGQNKNVKLLRLDVRNEQNVKDVLSAIGKQSAVLHLLVNNAAVDYGVDLETCTTEQWEEMFDVRCKGRFLTTKYAVDLMKRAGRSTIINITSSFAHEAHPEFPACAAAEAAAMNFTKSCALALTRYDIRTNSVNPGVTRTPLWDQFNVDDAGWEKMAKANPLGRNCTPEDVAKIIYYLDSEEAAYLNGEEIYVNGGNHLKCL